MERARLLARSDVILPEHLPRAVQQAAAWAGLPATDDATALDEAPAALCTLAASERASIRDALTRTKGNRTRAAQLLGISRRGLLKELKRLDP